MMYKVYWKTNDGRILDRIEQADSVLQLYRVYHDWMHRKRVMICHWF